MKTFDDECCEYLNISLLKKVLLSLAGFYSGPRPPFYVLSYNNTDEVDAGTFPSCSLKASLSAQEKLEV